MHTYFHKNCSCNLFCCHNSPDSSTSSLYHLCHNSPGLLELQLRPRDNMSDDNYDHNPHSSSYRNKLRNHKRLASFCNLQGQNHLVLKGAARLIRDNRHSNWTSTDSAWKHFDTDLHIRSRETEQQQRSILLMLYLLIHHIRGNFLLRNLKFKTRPQISCLNSSVLLTGYNIKPQH